VANWSDDPDDPVVLSRAAADQRILVTLDKDFGQLIELENQQHSGLVRLREQRPAYQVEAFRLLIGRHPEEIEGRVVIVSRLNIRFRN
jgi:predicted nuclease of predicted toxin-antitoxin system